MTWTWQLSQDQLMEFWKRKHLALHGHGIEVLLDIAPDAVYLTIQVDGPELRVMQEAIPNAKTRTDLLG